VKANINSLALRDSISSYGGRWIGGQDNGYQWYRHSNYGIIYCSDIIN
jgi:hypothetical protein